MTAFRNDMERRQLAWRDRHLPGVPGRGLSALRLRTADTTTYAAVPARRLAVAGRLPSHAHAEQEVEGVDRVIVIRVIVILIESVMLTHGDTCEGARSQCDLHAGTERRACVRVSAIVSADAREQIRTHPPERHGETQQR